MIKFKEENQTELSFDRRIRFMTITGLAQCALSTSVFPTWKNSLSRVASIMTHALELPNNSRFSRLRSFTNFGTRSYVGRFTTLRHHMRLSGVMTRRVGGGIPHDLAAFIKRPKTMEDP